MTWRLGGALVTLCLCACRPAEVMDAGVPDAGDPGLSIIETCDLMAAAKCELLQRCYLAFSRNTPDDCRALEQASCLAEYEALRPSFDGEKVKIDSAAVKACKARMEGSACPPTFPPGYSTAAQHPFADCELQTGLLAGQVASGETCALAVECQRGTVCVKQGGTCLGVCGAFAAAGEPCAFGCGAGLRCDDQNTADGSDDVCTVLRALNEPCASSVECEPQLVCKGSACRPRGKKGEGCAFDPNRLSTCDPGLACDVIPYVAGQVGSCVEPKGLLESCKYHWSCEPGLVCGDLPLDGFPTSAPAHDGKCVPPFPLGNVCDATPYAAFVGDACGQGTSCSQTEGTCAVAPKVGENCSPAAQNCVGVEVYCKPTGGAEGVCAGKSNIGDRCAFSLDSETTIQIPCTQGWCDAESTQSCRAAFRPVGAECQSDGECTSGRCAPSQDRALKCADAC